jgi:hypothetical protein
MLKNALRGDAVVVVFDRRLVDEALTHSLNSALSR